VKTRDEVPLALPVTLSQAERIEDEFVRRGPIAAAFRRVINETRRKEAQAKEKAPDDALIPVTVTVTVEQARTILSRYASLALDSPTDRAIFLLVKKALNETD
jgi:hypothetical protein